MPKVKFNQTVTTKSCPEDRLTFEEGEVYELSHASCEHWRKRGLAELYDEDEEAAKKVKRDAKGHHPAIHASENEKGAAKAPDKK